MEYNFNGTIKQNGTALSSGKVYLHKVTTTKMSFYIYNNTSTPFTDTTFKLWLKNSGFIQNYRFVGNSEFEISNTNDEIVMKLPYGVSVNNQGDTAAILGLLYNLTTGTMSTYTPTYSFSSDTVVEM